MKISLRILFFLFVAITIFSCKETNPNPVYIRANQVGYLPGDLKSAVVFSEFPLIEKEFSIIDINNNDEVLSKEITDSLYTYPGFDYCYTIDFSEITDDGKYEIEVDGKRSHSFIIGQNIYNHVVDSLTLFFKVQRCGPTNPLLHDKCHLSDVVRLVGDGGNFPVDVTGGWHDAGDYIKFLSTTAYTTYMLIFAYEFDKEKFGFDENNDNVPDMLAEAKVGLDWLLRANYSKFKLITQVQDLRDHEVGWRLPENDTLQYDRPGYIGMGKNQVGMFSAVMALGARVWADRFNDYEFADRLLEAAINIYSIRNDVDDIDVSQSGFYQDDKFWGKLALGAIELFKTTVEDKYLEDAKIYADSADSDYWWSWGNMNSLAHYRIAKLEPRFASYILNNLEAFNKNKNSSLFSEGLPYTWGTTNSLLGVSLQAILYKDLTGISKFDSLAILQRDYVLGRNPWGFTFIHNIGEKFPENLHSQVAYFNDGYLPGGLSAGPAPSSVLNNYNIERKVNSFNKFNTDSVKYFDDRNDYITNEPTIVSNATAVFVYGFYSDR